MFVNFFIKRPVFSTVCSLIVLLLGAIAALTLPIAQFPNITPTQVVVTANYTGASADTVESAVTNILEREINGVDGMKYISSVSSSDGLSQITVTFDADQDPDIATVNVQNRVARVEPLLPEAVVQNGLVVNKQSSAFLQAFAIYAENGEYDELFISNYLDTYVVDALRRVEGVGSVEVFGERKYAMRLWLDPNRLASRGLTMQSVVNAVREQNIQVGAGQIGQPPAPGQDYQISLRALSRLSSVEEFENVVVATGEDGALVRLRDVGRAELGAENYNVSLTYNSRYTSEDGTPIEAVGLGINQAPGTNALNASAAVTAEMERLSQAFPPGITYSLAFDTTMFVAASLRDVISTLVLAIALVVLVIYIFLQDWRATLIPSITIPISLVGTFIFTRLFGFSINTLTLFGMTLATGLVVDDAIVVVEAVTAKIHDRGFTPMQAAIAAMRELSGAIVATSLVLMAVFIPVAFFPGTTGAIYQQFALTIAFSILVSTFNALTLSPTLAAMLLRDKPPAHGPLGRLFERFNRGLDWSRRRYERSLHFLSHTRWLVVGAFGLLLVLTAWIYNLVPSAFLPDEDQGYFITIVQAPEGVSLEYTREVMDRASMTMLELPGVQSNFAVTGFSFPSGAPNRGIMFTLLEPWADRPLPVQAIIGQAFGALSQITEARIFPFNAPPIQGLDNFGGFQMELQALTEIPLDAFVGNAWQLIGVANQMPGGPPDAEAAAASEEIGAIASNVTNVLTTYATGTPKLVVEVDRNRAKALGVDVDEVFGVMQTALGSQYVNDFELGQRNYRVYVQADLPFRNNPEDVNQLYVRSAQDEMIPLSNLVTLTSSTGAQTINHYNLFRSISVNGNAAPGKSSGQALVAMEQLVQRVLPPTISFEWTGNALEEIQSAGQAPIIFGIGLLMVFLVLAAQYESYVTPIVIMLTVPLAILGALLSQLLRGLPNDIYCQIGLVMLIGLASKNAILVVEYADQLREQGFDLVKAAIEAGQERLRPILMTAFSGLIGFFPLLIATGAGAASRRSIGTAVFGGYLVATFLSLFLVPILYIVIKSISERGKRDRQPHLPDADRDGHSALGNGWSEPDHQPPQLPEAPAREL
ncbi:MAG: efflux RND transporter permease subunit [Spirulinaceae cyanobacterium SM2_1_0]|nr:efflux RND transporter permease subunit [Spirulinaceae cyanobacterium SM2_1_0]